MEEFEHLNENSEDKIEKLKLIEQYKKYRHTFKFAREEINPKELSVEELKVEIEMLEQELNSKGALCAFQAILFTSFSFLEHSSKLMNIGLKLDGLADAAVKQRDSYEQVMKELMIKWGLFSPGPEMRFTMLVLQTIYLTHHANVELEKRKEINQNIDPQKIQELKEKYNNI